MAISSASTFRLAVHLLAWLSELCASRPLPFLLSQRIEAS